MGLTPSSFITVSLYLVIFMSLYIVLTVTLFFNIKSTTNKLLCLLQHNVLLHYVHGSWQRPQVDILGCMGIQLEILQMLVFHVFLEGWI